MFTCTCVIARDVTGYVHNWICVKDVTGYVHNLAIMNLEQILTLEFKTSVVRRRTQLRFCEMDTKVNVRTCGDNIILTITKTEIDTLYRE